MKFLILSLICIIIYFSSASEGEKNKSEICYGFAVSVYNATFKGCTNRDYITIPLEDLMRFCTERSKEALNLTYKQCLTLVDKNEVDKNEVV